MKETTGVRAWQKEQRVRVVVGGSGDDEAASGKCGEGVGGAGPPAGDLTE